MKASSNKSSLRGKRCVVTGGGSGIGAGITRCLVAAGASVAIVGRRRANLKRVAAELNTGKRERVFAVTGDITDEAGIARAIQRAQKALGGLDVLVNNAGVGGPNGLAVDGPDRWHEVVHANLDGTYYVTRAALPHLPKGGRVINISSVLGRFGVPGYTAYCTAKHGIVGFTKALALELAPREVTVNAICPGWVDTDMAAEGLQGMADGLGIPFEQAKSQAMAAVPIGRILQPEEIGELVVWLASPFASGMTGQAISHCGGQVMW